MDVVCRVCLGETDGFELLLQDGNYKVVAVDCLSMIEGVIQDAGLEWIKNSRAARLAPSPSVSTRSQALWGDLRNGQET